MPRGTADIGKSSLLLSFKKEDSSFFEKKKQKTFTCSLCLHGVVCTGAECFG
jgi:hypothetical protein